MTIVITMKILAIIVAAIAINFICFSAVVYFDIRYLKGDAFDYDDMPAAIPYLLGLLFGTMIVIAIIASKFKKYKTGFPSVVDLAKKHRAQDEDVTYQAEKYLLDKK